MKKLIVTGMVAVICAMLCAWAQIVLGEEKEYTAPVISESEETLTYNDRTYYYLAEKLTNVDGINTWLVIYRNTEDEIPHGVMCLLALDEETLDEDRYYGFMIVENEPALYEKKKVEENFMIYDMNCDDIFETKTEIKFGESFLAPDCLKNQEPTDDSNQLERININYGIKL